MAAHTLKLWILHRWILMSFVNSLLSDAMYVDQRELSIEVVNEENGHETI
jgi:hypothetical protein